MRVSGQFHAPATFSSSTRWLHDWVALRVVLKKWCLYRKSNPDRPVCSQSLNW